MTTVIVLLGEVGDTVLTALAVITLSLVVPVRVKNKFVPSYSIDPATGVVKFVPLVSLIGAIDVVPAAMCSNAAGVFIVPKPTLFSESRVKAVFPCPSKS